MQATLRNTSRFYLVVKFLRAKNDVLHKYVGAKGTNCFTYFWDNNKFSEVILSKKNCSSYCLNRIFMGVY